MPKILIVDDEKHVCQQMRKLFDSYGYDSGFILKPDLLFKRLQTDNCDLILMDIYMPGTSGVTLLQEIKEHPEYRDIPVIMLTGDPDEQLLAECFEHGAADFVNKPVREVILHARVKAALENRNYIHLITDKNEQIDEALREKEKIFQEIEELLRQFQLQNKLLKNTFDCMAEGVIRLSNNFAIQMMSTRACEVLEMSEKEALSKPAVSILGTSVAGPQGILIKAAKQNKNLRSVRTNLMCPSGSVVPVVLSVIPLEEASEISGWLLVFRNLREEERQLRKNDKTVSFGGLVSSDTKMKEIFEVVDKIAKKNIPVLIEGESGTGKEMMSHEIHTRSHRAQNLFHAVNCAAIVPNLLESEFFGHEKGAFTGADRSKPGRFELADGGTLLLDEIGEIPLELQSKLLRVLQEKKFERVGGTKTIKVDVRIIAATNQNLHMMVKEKKFREDLFYRLNVVQIQLPPLRERAQDIPLLIMAIIEKLNQKYNRKVQTVAPKAMRRLVEYSWPGNIRELYHAIEYAFAFSEGAILHQRHLPEKLQNVSDYVALPSSPVPQNEKDLILQTLVQTNFRKSKAAALLGIHPTTLSRKLKKYGI